MLGMVKMGCNESVNKTMAGTGEEDEGEQRIW